jgi:hypothetical protein
MSAGARRVNFSQRMYTVNGPRRRSGAPAGRRLVARLTPSDRPKRRWNFASPVM